MITCPDCGHANIPGVDQCEQCQQSLSALSKPKPASPEEWHIVKDRIETLAPREPLTVPPETPIRDVLQLLANHRIGCLLVVEDDRVVGIFSERDALMKLNTEAGALGDQPVADYMTPEPQTLEMSDKIAFALHRMDLGGYRHIPILADGLPVGIVSVRDILRYISQRLVAEPI